MFDDMENFAFDFNILRFENAICTKNTTRVELVPNYCKFSGNFTDVVIREMSPVYTRVDERVQITIM